MNPCTRGPRHFLWLCRYVICAAALVASGVHAAARAPTAAVGVPTAPVAPLLLPEDYLTAPAPACDARHVPKLRALLAGVSEYGNEKRNLKGPPNDARMLAGALERLGAQVTVQSGLVARSTFTGEVAKLARQAQCGNTMLLLFSGQADNGTMGRTMMAFSDSDSADCSRAADTPYPDGIDTPAPNRPIATGCLDSDELVVLANWLTGRGVNFSMIVDAAASRDIGSRFLSDAGGVWLWNPWEKRLPGQSEVVRELGARTILVAPALVHELRPPGADRTYGAWTYALSSALLTESGEASLRKLAEVAARNHDDATFGDRRGKPQDGPIFASSHPDRPFLATGSPSRPQTAPTRGLQDKGQIVIDSPTVAATRGATRVSTTQLAIAGRVLSPQRPRAVQVNNQEARLNPDGSFVAQVPIERGENRITVVAWLAQDEFIPAAFTVVGTPNDELGAIGQRYALVIGIQNYQDTNFSRLSTPHDDANAVAQLLERRYGFTLQLPTAGGGSRPLLLRDAGKQEMERTLSALRHVLRPEDSLLIYFAGHGVYEKETRKAYWLPVDAEQEEPSTWLDAETVAVAIQRLNVRHVLVVADSCFAGAVQLRSAEAGVSGSQDRQNFLTQRMTRPSRQYMTAGANEPVLDGGGGGHSIFARSFLDALRNAKQPLTASELYANHLAPEVGGQARQQPQLSQMKEHDGGDLVFFPQGK